MLFTLRLITAVSAVFVVMPYFGLGWFDVLQSVTGQQILRLVLLPFLFVQALHWYSSKRHIEAATSFFFVVILFVELLGTVPFIANKPDSPKALRVMTFNSQGHGEGSWLSWLKQDAIDLACVQELPKSGMDYIREYGPRFGFPYMNVQYAEDGTAGVVLLSRTPFVYADSIQVPDLEDTHRFFPAVGVISDGDTVHVIGVHMASTPRWAPISKVGKAWNVREHQVKRVLERVETVDGPVIVLGDFNSTPTDRLMRLMRGSLSDMWMAGGSGMGATWPSGLPFLRIDQVFARDFDGISRIMSEPLAVSDHLAVSLSLHREKVTD